MLDDVIVVLEIEYVTPCMPGGAILTPCMPGGAFMDIYFFCLCNYAL